MFLFGIQRNVAARDTLKYVSTKNASDDVVVRMCCIKTCALLGYRLVSMECVNACVCTNCISMWLHVEMYLKSMDLTTPLYEVHLEMRLKEMHLSCVHL
jgi:hypothetical protein